MQLPLSSGMVKFVKKELFIYSKKHECWLGQRTRVGYARTHCAAVDAAACASVAELFFFRSEERRVGKEWMRFSGWVVHVGGFGNWEKWPSRSFLVANYSMLILFTKIPLIIIIFSKNPCNFFYSDFLFKLYWSYIHAIGKDK